MTTATEQRQTFSVEHGRLIRTVGPELRHPRMTRGYQPRCCQATLEEVAHTLAEHRHDGITTNELWLRLRPRGHTNTQVSVALAFLKERGIADVEFGRRTYAACDDPHLDAMTEFHWLRETGSTV